MQIKKLGPNMTELSYKDGRRVLVSYETPVAAFTPDYRVPYSHWAGPTWLKNKRFVSRSSQDHAKAWLEENCAQSVRTVAQEVIEEMMD
jgi:hypothetical protein